LYHRFAAGAAGHLTQGVFLPAGEETKHAQGDAYPTLTSSSIEDLAASFGASSANARLSTSILSPSESFCRRISWPLLKRMASRYLNGADEFGRQRFIQDGDHLLGVSLVPVSDGALLKALARATPKLFDIR